MAIAAAIAMPMSGNSGVPQERSEVAACEYLPC
jgi:hypothetical protein